MPASQSIDDFITKHRPQPVCQSCIAGGVGMTDDALCSQEISAALATSGDFIRGWGRCSVCAKESSVIKRC